MQKLYIAFSAAALLLSLYGIAQAGYLSRYKCLNLYGEAEAQCKRLADIEDRLENLTRKDDERDSKERMLSFCLSGASSPSQIRNCHLFN